MSLVSRRLIPLLCLSPTFDWHDAVHSAEACQSNGAVLLPQIGTHIRAKRKREELSNVLAAMRKAAAKKD